MGAFATVGAQGGTEMELAAIKAFLEENGSNPEVQQFVEGLNPITPEKVKNFAGANPEIQGWLQSQKDSHFDKSIETWKKNNLDELVMGKVKELYPEETEEQKRIRMLEQKLAEAEGKEQREALRNKALTIATEKKLPTNLLDHFLGEDEETTLANLAKLEETLNPWVESQVNAEVENRFKDSGRKFQQGSGGETSTAATIAQKLNEQKQTQQNSTWGI